MITKAIVLLITTCLTYYVACQEFTVDGRYIYNNGEVFTALGVNYSPVPIGGSQGFVETDRGDVFSNDWTFIHERDIPLMREMGINSIRVYNFFPWKFPTAQSPEWSQGNHNDHTDFLDLCWNGGENPVYVWVSFQVPTCFHYTTAADQPSSGVSWRLQNGRWAYVDPDTVEEDALTRQFVENSYQKLAEHYGGHPAVIGFVIGNEQNDEIARSSPVYWNWVNSVAKIIKNEVEDKLTMISIVDDGTLTVRAAVALGALKDIDVWGINSYRGTVHTGFDTLFTDYAAVSNKPLLVTEFGPPASTRGDDDEVIELPDNAQAQADYILVHFEDIVAHRSICSGGYIFEWSDEWWKSVDPTQQDPSNAPNGAYPGGQGDEEYFGIFSIALISEEAAVEDYRTRGADLMVPRAAVTVVTEMYNSYDHENIPDQEPLVPEAPVAPSPVGENPTAPPSSPSPEPEAKQPGQGSVDDDDDEDQGTNSSTKAILNFFVVFSVFFIWTL